MSVTRYPPPPLPDIGTAAERAARRVDYLPTLQRDGVECTSRRVIIVEGDVERPGWLYGMHILGAGYPHRCPRCGESLQLGVRRDG